MKDKTAIKIIEQKVIEGQPKKEIYRELLGKVKFRSDLIQFLAMVPEKDLRRQYKWHNLVLFYFLIFISISKIIYAASILGSISPYLLLFSLFVPAISVFFAYMVWNFRGNMYRVLGMLGIASLLHSVSDLDELYSYSSTDWAIQSIMVYIPAVLVVVLAYYIGFKVFPYYGFWGSLNETELEY
jgi:hypothetical protein